MPRLAGAMLWKRALYWLLLYSVLWGILSGGAGWAFGLSSAALAALMSVRLGLSPIRVRWYYLPRFVSFFIGAVFAGGWDVARRALDPRLPLHPAWVSYSLTQTNPRVSLLLSAMVGLLPGTLASRVGAGQVQLHVLDARQDWNSTVARLERHLSDLLGADS